jgi:glycyl-tRNA synthetase
MQEQKNDLMEKIVSLCKRRGFIFPACEIYGGFANSYSFGPYGVELKNNIKRLWWKTFVHQRKDIIGIDGPILLHPKLWEASGHVAGFNDAMVDCKQCKKRFRADHLVEDLTGEDMEGRLEDMTKVLQEKKAPCPNCGASDWTQVRNFNMMFKTEMNGVNEPAVYLRPETAGAIFVDYKNVLDSMRVKVPFGIAQIGKAFRNEIVAGNFIFRLREFEQMEIEYFIEPDTDWQPLFEQWLDWQEQFALNIGVRKELLSRYEHPKEKLSHYSKKTIDTMCDFPFGIKELYGLAHRSDFDLSQHAKYSGQKLDYYDGEKNVRYVPHVLEPTFGVERSVLAVLASCYAEEDVVSANGEKESRVVMRFPKKVAPVKVAVLPLSKKPELSVMASKVWESLASRFNTEYDETQSIGKRYRRQDEIGTPYCVTVDFDSLQDNAVTVRDRDTMKQDRIKIAELADYLEKQLD